MPGITQILRRFYSDLIKGRTRVAVHSSGEPELGEDPIFIIGLFRSGTTLLRYLVDSHSRIACPPETRFMQHLAGIIESERTLGGLQAMGFDREHTCQRLRQTISYFMENYASSKGKPRWADKTPEYVSSVASLQEIYPTAKFVMLYRNPLDQIRSNIKSGLGLADRIGDFAEDNEYLAAANYWSAQSQVMIDFENKYPEQTHRVKYEDLCENPEAILTSMLGFLGESWESEMLEYYKFEHDYGAEDGKVGSSRKIARSTHDYSTWDPENLRLSVEKTSVVGSVLGYDLESLVSEH